MPFNAYIGTIDEVIAQLRHDACHHIKHGRIKLGMSLFFDSLMLEQDLTNIQNN